MSNNIFLLTICLLSFVFANCQVVINEYSASNLNDFPDDYSKYEDWIELYNTSDNPVNLKGWFISDKEAKPGKWEIKNDLIIDGNGYLILWCSGRDTIDDQYHTNFKLTQTKGNEVLSIAALDTVPINLIPMELTKLGHSRARAEDGTGNWMVSVNPTLGYTNDNAEMYTGYTQEVATNVLAGFYDEPQEITFNTFQLDVEIYYTLDGTEPTQSDMLWEGTPIMIDETTVVKAKAFSSNPDILPGKIIFNTYFINESFTVPVFSVAADDIQDLANGEGALRPQGTVEYFVDGEFVDGSYGELNRHGQDSWILPHRSLDWITRDEMGYGKDIKAKLFNYSDRDNHQRLMFRASGDDNYPANGDFNHEGSCHIRDEYTHVLAQEGSMKLDVRAVERVVLFLDGEYWGLYGLRERPVDHDYTEEYYDQGKYDLQYLATWGGTWAEYGGNQAFVDWIELRDFILDEDMSNEANYEYVKSQMQVKSLIDYMLVNLNTVASDWLNYNTGWWRGMDPEGDHKKWGYILWDNDATFDYYINYSGVPNTDPDADPCDIEEIGEFMDDFFNNGGVGQHEKLFLKMIDESDEFRQLYYSRQADLINTAFSCETMHTKFDSLIAIIEPEMPRQIARWGGSMAEWQANVADMKQFIDDRCNYLAQGMLNCYNLEGPYSVTLDVEPAGSGEIEFNTLDIEQFPWTGDYYGLMPNLIKAKALDETKPFLFWKTMNGSVVSPDSTLVEAEIYFDNEETLIAVFGDVTGVFEKEFTTEWNVYPTITTSQLSIIAEFEHSNTANFELLDMRGQKVQDFTIGGQVQGSKYHWTINISESLPAGMYVVKMTTEEGILSKRIIKE